MLPIPIKGEYFHYRIRLTNKTGEYMTFLYIILFLTVLSVSTPFILKLQYPHKINWKEVILSIVVSLLISGISVALSVGNIYNTELLHGQVVNKQRVKTSCEHSYSCNCRTTTNSNGNSSTTCDTCYEHSHDYDWTVYTTVGNIDIVRIDRRGDNEPPRFSKVEIGEPASKESWYVDYIKGSYSVFNIQDNPVDHPFKHIIPRYPNVNDYYNTNLVLSTHRIPSDIKRLINDGLRDSLRSLGRKRQVNAVVVITDKDQSFGEFLRNEWNNGRKNDAIIVIGVNKENEILWSFVFGWSENKLFDIQLRNELNDIVSITNTTEIVTTITNNIDKYFTRQSMSDFKYLLYERDVSGWMILFILFLQLGANIGISVFNYKVHL